MGKLSLSLFALGVAACGSDNKGTADAKTFMDAPPKVFMDAPPKVYMDAPPKVYDFTCFGMTASATAPDPLALTGTAETLNGQTPTPVKSRIHIFNGTTSIYDMPSADNGTFTASLVTGGHPIDGYVIATDVNAQGQELATPTNRSTYFYPPGPVAAATDVTVPRIAPSLVSTLTQLGITQNDTTNGFLVVPVVDCTNGTPVPIDGATLSVKQGGTDVGMAIDVGQFVSQLAGIWLVANVPDGDTTVGASYGNMTFPSHVVKAHKKTADGADQLGTVTITSVRPGP